MINYYEILGVSREAHSSEIKAAFRRLAMAYHPDKNPEGKEHFAQVLKAYETLSDPTLRHTYDYRLQQGLAESQAISPKRTSHKTWGFSEKEMKRRRYYEEHIKKYAKTNPVTEESTARKNYNEFKYILFATPLAALLFLLVVKLASLWSAPDPTPMAVFQDSAVLTASLQAMALYKGDTLYAAHFGGGKFYYQYNKTIQIKNLTGADIIVCLFTQTDFVRSVYIKHNYSALLSHLPSSGLYMRYCSGNGFDKTQGAKQVDVYGTFTQNTKYFRSLASLPLNTSGGFTLLPGTNNGFEYSNEKDFFKKQQ